MIYIAGPLFTEAERDYLEKIDRMCKRRGFKTFLPHRDAGIYEGGSSYTIYKADKEMLAKAMLVIAVLDGTDVDSGTAWEIGCATAIGKKVVGICTDVRCKSGKMNLMITNSVEILKSLNELGRFLNEFKENRKR